jgi:GTP cyclohydrolase IB
MSEVSLKAAASPNDSAHQAKPQHPRTLAWAGMRRIQAMLQIGRLQLPAKADLMVSLDNAGSRGIHMSRLYALLDERLNTQALSLSVLPVWLAQLRESQENLSQRVKLTLDFLLPVRRAALKSDRSGWRHYPVSITAILGTSCTVELAFELLYSSTCPCSAALARQSIQQNFHAQFDGIAQLDTNAVEAWLGRADSIIATPHAQRSELKVTLMLSDALLKDSDSDGIQLYGLISALIGAIETQLSTPVQTAVKRVDEQAFAELNGQNPMFVEDAVRKVAAWLDHYPRFVDFKVQATHLESLHPHDAVAVVVKGVANGYC